MSMDDGILASAIKATLSEPAIQMVNFRAQGLGIGTMHFMYVSSFITAGFIKCKVDESKLRGVAAVYSSSDKTIFARATRGGGYYADEKVKFVHECTHAAIHLMGAQRDITVKILDNEIAAHLAGAIYVRVSGQTPSFVDAPHRAAYTIVQNRMITTPTNASPTNAGSPIEFDNAELRPLITAIQGSPLYRDWNRNEVYRWG